MRAAAGDHAGRLGHVGVQFLGKACQFGVLAKTHRLRRQAEELHAKIDQYKRLISERGGHPLVARLDVLRNEARYVADKRTHLNEALAASAARWAVDQALAVGATAVYIEDLRTLEARGMGKNLNARISQAVRSRIADKLRYAVAEHGIAVVTVPPGGTSKNCPRCLAPLRHSKFPDRPTAPGWKWARCPGCDWQGDPDQGA